MHNHAHCIEAAVKDAERLCAERGVRLTGQRRGILELVWTSHKPIGAYEILALLSQTSGRTIAPPTVYRALDFFLEQGLVHRLASLNAYIGCNQPHSAHKGHFFICRICSAALELERGLIDDAIAASAQKAHFAAEQQVVEVIGLCRSCQSYAG